MAAKSRRKLTSQFPRNHRGQRQHHQRHWHHHPQQEVASALSGTRLFVGKQCDDKVSQMKLHKSYKVNRDWIFENLQPPQRWWTESPTNPLAVNLEVQGDKGVSRRVKKMSSERKFCFQAPASPVVTVSTLLALLVPEKLSANMRML